MPEFVPIVLSFCLGGYLCLSTKRPANVALVSVGIVLFIASSAFVMSGESNLSWAYFLLDFIQASLGLLADIAALRAVRRAPDLSKI